jgi:tetratricopeptide (TPR) repeat protein
VTLAVFVAAAAFLLASFPARNSDLWRHLAAGRDLAQSSPADLGKRLSAGGPPSWPYDLLCYALYSVVGGGGLVFCKALLVVGLALVLLRLASLPARPTSLSPGPRAEGWWIPAVCTVLALLTMSTRLLLQPATCSYLLLALAVWSAFGHRRGISDPAPFLPPWPLLVLFVVWANLDSGFVIGLGTVALVWLGQTLDSLAKRQGDRNLGHLLVPLFLLAAVCLLNPSGIKAFQFPVARGQAISPFQGAYFATIGLSPAGLAYFVLLVLGLLSFALAALGRRMPDHAGPARWHWQRFLPWVGLALGSAVDVRLIPFFAVVASPVLAWNLREYQGSQIAGLSILDPRSSILGGILTAGLGLAFLACAWPGWLQAPPYEPRRWEVETSPSLEQGARTARRWHREGKLGVEARGLHLSAETANAFAWFCPEEKGLRDDRLTAAILGLPGAAEDWAEQLRAAGVNHVIVYDPQVGRLARALERLLADPGQWPFLYLEGNLAVFGWRDPARKGSAELFRGQELNLNWLAFRPAESQKAPPARPEPEPEPRHWWDAFWKPVKRPSLAGAEATFHLLHAEVLRRSAPPRHLAAWEASQAAAIVGAAGGWAGPGGVLDAHLRRLLFRPRIPGGAAASGDPRRARGAGRGLRSPELPVLDRVALALQRRFTLHRDDLPPALLYLAIRAGRRAITANPEDARAYLVLGQSYQRLLHNTRERAWGTRLNQLVQLRRVQASAALNQAVVLNPDLAQAHLSLAELYQGMGYLDLAHKHLRTYLRLIRRKGAPPGVSAEQFDRQTEAYEQGLSRLAEVVEAREQAYSSAAAGLKVLDRAMLAKRLGLAGKALDILLESDISAFGPAGMALELGLLLRTGRVKEVREWTGEEQTSDMQKADLGPKTYHWLRAQAFAGSGDYALAEEELSQLAAGGRPRGPIGPRQNMALVISQTVLYEKPGPGSVPYFFLLTFRRAQFLGRHLQQEADATVLRGLLLLEEGEVDEAETAFRLALALWKNRAAVAAGAGMDFGGRGVAQGCLEWLEE